MNITARSWTRNSERITNPGPQNTFWEFHQHLNCSCIRAVLIAQTVVLMFRLSSNLFHIISFCNTFNKFVGQNNLLILRAYYILRDFFPKVCFSCPQEPIFLFPLYYDKAYMYGNTEPICGFLALVVLCCKLTCSRIVRNM